MGVVNCPIRTGSGESGGTRVGGRVVSKRFNDNLVKRILEFVCHQLPQSYGRSRTLEDLCAGISLVRVCVYI